MGSLGRLHITGGDSGLEKGPNSMEETIKNNTEEILINLDETSSSKPVEEVFKKSTSMARTPPHGGKPQTPEIGVWQHKWKVLEEEFKQLYDLVMSKKNIHQEIKEKTRRVKVKMAEAKNAAGNESEAMKPTKETVKSVATQTEKPASKGVGTPQTVKVPKNGKNTEKRKREAEAEKGSSPKQRRRGGEMDTPKT